MLSTAFQHAWQTNICRLEECIISYTMNRCFCLFCFNLLEFENFTVFFWFLIHFDFGAKERLADHEVHLVADEDSGEPRGVVSTLAPHHQDFFGAQGYRTKPSFATLTGKGDNPTSTVLQSEEIGIRYTTSSFL